MELPHELRVSYYNRRLDDYAGCLKAIEAQKTDFLETVGHQMRGNAEPYGFNELAVIGKDLEIAAKAKDWQAIKSLVEKFGTYLTLHPLRRLPS